MDEGEGHIYHFPGEGEAKLKFDFQQIYHSRVEITIEPVRLVERVGTSEPQNSPGSSRRRPGLVQSSGISGLPTLFYQDARTDENEHSGWFGNCVVQGKEDDRRPSEIM